MARNIRTGRGWPVNHLNADTAGVKQLLAAPGNKNSHFVTGMVLNGRTDDDGITLLRRDCLVFNSGTDTWTVPDNSTDLDWGTLAADGDFSLEVWINIPAATAAIVSLLKRGDETNDGWLLEITATGKAKFSFDDGTNDAIITGGTDLGDGAWHLITVTVDRSSTTGLNIFVDGVIDATPVDPTAVTGALAGGTTAVMTGVANKTFYVSAVGLYINALISATTVLSNYNEGFGKKYSGGETDLTMAYNNDEGIGTTNYDILNTTAHDVTNSNTTWAPSIQNGATAAVEVCGVPFDSEVVTHHVGKFTTGKITTDGVMSPVVLALPEESYIKIGRNCPLNILETNGAFDLQLFGFTADYRWSPGYRE